MTFNAGIPTRSTGTIDAELRAHQKLSAGRLNTNDHGSGTSHTAESLKQKLTVGDLMSYAHSLALQDSSLSKEQHFARLLRANPSAYEEYLAANPAQTGRR